MQRPTWLLCAGVLALTAGWCGCVRERVVVERPPQRVIYVEGQPAPAAVVEVVPARPQVAVVWVPGHWIRAGGYWEWVPGHWREVR